MTVYRAPAAAASDIRRPSDMASHPAAGRRVPMLSAGEGGGPAAAPGTGPVAGDRAALSLDRRKLRVAVVDDEAIIALEIEDMLADLGAEVVGTAQNAEQAIRLAETTRPDCLTMDIRLQGERDGVSAAIEIFERLGIRCIFVSAYNDPETVARAEAAKPLGWLNKPIRADRMRASLRALTDEPPVP